MKQIAILFIFIPGILFSMDIPISLILKKKSQTNYSLKISVPKGYGIQKDAPHKIKLNTEGNLKVESFSQNLTGILFLDKPDYYEKVDDLDIKLKGSGALLIETKIFYCDLIKGICYPGKISKRETIQ
ncbi:MAG: hypothetical protein EBS19_10030 [Spirochaetia bacterium]|nr:hypothetical protein [Spirochaetia bacterium]